MSEPQPIRNADGPLIATGRLSRTRTALAASRRGTRDQKSKGGQPGSRSSSVASGPPIDRNRLLCALSPAVYADLLPHLESVNLVHGDVIYEPNVPATHIYFPETAVFSMVRHMVDGSGIEVGTIGRDGVVGGAVISGAASMSACCVVQIAGRAQRITTKALLAAVARPAPAVKNGARAGVTLAELMWRYGQALFEQVAQSAACNRLHPLEQRCARWLLMTHDRVSGNELALTQEFLSYMLGVRRAGVTEACGTLQRSALIRYHHGHITIVDRPGLEAVACECYGVAAHAYTTLLGPLLDRPDDPC